MKKAEIVNLPSVGYWSACGGVEVKKIEYGIHDRVWCVSNAWYGGEKAKQPHMVKIQYTPSGLPFIRVNGYRLLLDECIRMG